LRISSAEREEAGVRLEEEEEEEEQQQKIIRIMRVERKNSGKKQ